MTKTPWKPWHEVVDLRDELKTGELSLSMFAADLYDVIMGRAKPLYQGFRLAPPAGSCSLNRDRATSYAPEFRSAGAARSVFVW
jgi:hypothetical protein